MSQVVAGAVAVQVAPPGAAVTVYPVMAEPPSEAGGSQVMVAVVPLRVAFVFRGAVGGSRLCSSVTVLLL